MKIKSNDFRVGEGAKVDLDAWPTSIEPVYASKKHYHESLVEHVAQLSARYSSFFTHPTPMPYC